MALSGLKPVFAQLVIRPIDIQKECSMNTFGPGPGAPRVGYSESDNPDGGQHHTLHDDEQDPGHENHISWDTDRDGDYRQGTGHEDRDGRNVGNWDRGG